MHTPPVYKPQYGVLAQVQKKNTRSQGLQTVLYQLQLVSQSHLQNETNQDI